MLALAETHLIGNDELRVAGYAWFGQNRSNIHIKAKWLSQLKISLLVIITFRF